MAIHRLILRDFVIVRELELDLSSGFTALTGETGAGKSILIDAIQMALGERANAGVVRDGANKADIAIEFDRTPVMKQIIYSFVAPSIPQAKAELGLTAAPLRLPSCVS